MLPTTAGALTEHVAALLSRGQAAVEAIGSAAPDANSRKDADAFQQLQLIRQMVQLAGQQQWDRVLQVNRICYCHPCFGLQAVIVDYCSSEQPRLANVQAVNGLALWQAFTCRLVHNKHTIYSHTVLLCSTDARIVHVALCKLHVER